MNISHRVGAILFIDHISNTSAPCQPTSTPLSPLHPINSLYILSTHSINTIFYHQVATRLNYHSTHPNRFSSLSHTYQPFQPTLSTYLNPLYQFTHTLSTHSINTTTGRYTIELPLHPPESFLLVIGMTNEHGQYYEDTVPVRLLNILPDTLPPLLV